MVHPTVTIQISEVSVPSTPSWLGEAAAFAHILRHLGQLEAIEQRVRFARARFGYYDTLRCFSPLESAPLPLPLSPVLWKDWPRCRIRRAWLKIIRSETVRWESSATLAPSPVTTATEGASTRAQRAHWRLSWGQRSTRNARPPDASPLTVTLHGLSASFAHFFGFAFLATA